MEAISTTKTTQGMQEELTESEALDRVLAAFDARLDELRWRQDEHGVLYAASSSEPDMIARLEITESGSCDAAVADINDVPIEWHTLERVPMIGNETNVQD